MLSQEKMSNGEGAMGSRRDQRTVVAACRGS